MPSNRGMLSEKTRSRMVERLAQQGIHDHRVLKAMQHVPRHLFIDEALATMAYEDKSLPIGYGQTISQPYIVARMTALLLEKNMPKKVLEIGTGCGYQSAILLAAGVQEVYSVERLGALLKLARQNLRRAHLTNVRLIHQDGCEGLPEAAPFDGILITAATERILPPLFNQLSAEGRLVAPLGDTQSQQLWYFEKEEDKLQEKTLEAVRFVPLLTGKA